MAQERSELVKTPWGLRIAVKGALCSDGKRRYARITGEPDTFFSLPAQVRVSTSQGRFCVTGFLTVDSCAEGEEYFFIANKYGKNGHLLPGTRPETHPYF